MAGGGPGGDRAAEILTSQIARTHESPRRTLSHRPNARIEAPVIIGARESKVGAGRALALSWPFLDGPGWFWEGPDAPESVAIA